ncbi:centromere/microtubule binding protein cbf5 [Perkinsela sp. CCAP 1560/4]|nr:centromere/microtubule binding protein cbf5 [Perkinsela sp. CCAP 1560/4]|eukprot:KNH07123.1 centromere/microtubule binding protein cbf5 [Perkinsela sp. CCAP 1560/4]
MIESNPAQYIIQSEEKSDSKPTDTSHWPLLLKDYSKMNIKKTQFNPILDAGYSPLHRPIQEHINYGTINIDKPSNPSSHEVVSWIKRIVGAEKTGHSGTLDPKVTGNLIVCLNRATRLVKSQQNQPKEYITVMKLHGPVEGGRKAINEALQTLTGAVFQRPPIQSAVKRQLRIRSIYQNTLLEYDEKRGLVVFSIQCEAGTYVRTLCVHLGLILGVGAHMEELRRVATGNITEEDNLVTLHDLLDACWLMKNKKQEWYIRQVIDPCEVLLAAGSSRMNRQMGGGGYKRIVVKDTAVNALCYGAKLMVQGVLRYDNAVGDDRKEVIVLITTKGEAIALAFASMSASQIETAEFGIAAVLKRVIMDRNVYPRRWGLGPTALLIRKMIESGELDKYGRVTDKTPFNFKYVDFGGVSSNEQGQWAKGSAQPSTVESTNPSKRTREEDNYSE